MPVAEIGSSSTEDLGTKNIIIVSDLTVARILSLRWKEARKRLSMDMMFYSSREGHLRYMSSIHEPLDLHHRDERVPEVEDR